MVAVCDRSASHRSSSQGESTRHAHAEGQMGQKKTVRVFQLIAENTIEAKVLDIRASSG